MTNRELPCTSPLRVETTRPVMRMGCRENLYKQRQRQRWKNKGSAEKGKFIACVFTWRDEYKKEAVQFTCRHRGMNGEEWK